MSLLTNFPWSRFAFVQGNACEKRLIRCLIHKFWPGALSREFRGEFRGHNT
jgi:hypothetical protein